MIKKAWNRRGAMLVLAATVMVLMLGFLAFAIDLSRLYAQKNQLQTAADAASIAAVIQLINDTTSVRTTASTYSQSNRVFGKSIAVPAADVVCGTWDDVGGTFTPSAGSPTKCGSAENAVAVTVRDSASYLSPVLLGRPGKQLSATGRAWLAFVGSASCFTPWGIPYQTLTKLLKPGDPDTLRALDAIDLQRLRSYTSAQLRFKLNGGGPLSSGAVAGIIILGKAYVSQ
ncbi:MAG TPA: pilus assembly protein TadG-related protein, partial [Anaerolineales bacterium]